MDNLDKLVETISSLKEDYEKFFIKSNHAAGTRLRKKMQEVKKLAQDIRDCVQAKKSEK
jgi:predicted MPP superfamily phosphohydrolase